MFQRFEVGKPTGLIGPDGVIFDMTDGGGVLIVRMSRPTANEKKAFKAGISLRFCIVDQVIFVLVRMGLTQWMDAPYYRALSRNLSRVTLPMDGQGLAVHAMLIDGADGTLVAQKLFSPDTTTSARLMAACISQPMIPDYDSRLVRIYRQYSTQQLVALSRKQEIEGKNGSN